MDNKELKIVPPSGYEIDKENSTLECIKFKSIKKKLTYNDVAFELFSHNRWIIKEFGKIVNKAVPNANISYPTLCTSKKQAQKLLAINKLMNAAKYLNGDWKPDWDNACQDKFYIFVDDEEVGVDVCTIFCEAMIYFKSKEIAKQVVEILGEDEVRLALSTDW